MPIELKVGKLSEVFNPYLEEYAFEMIEDYYPNYDDKNIILKTAKAGHSEFWEELREDSDDFFTGEGGSVHIERMDTAVNVWVSTKIKDLSLAFDIFMGFTGTICSLEGLIKELTLMVKAFIKNDDWSLPSDLNESKLEKWIINADEEIESGKEMTYSNQEYLVANLLVMAKYAQKNKQPLWMFNYPPL